MSDGEVKFSSLSGFMQGILILLSILGVIVPAVLGFVNFDKRLDIAENTTATHIEKDEKRWERIDDDVSRLDNTVHQLELTDKELLIHYNEIIRRLDRGDLMDQRILDKLETFEGTNQ